MSLPAQPSDGRPAPPPISDPPDLAAVETELVALQMLPLAEQVPVYERLHARLAAALAEAGAEDDGSLQATANGEGASTTSANPVAD